MGLANVRVVISDAYSYSCELVVDFRSDKSESVEGKGRARRAWDAYAKTVNAAGLPILEPAIRRVAVRWSEDLLGFWLMWHIYGGFEGLAELGMHPSTIWRKIGRFRKAFGMHPDEFRLPGVELNLPKVWSAARQDPTANAG
jgi:hypothetical protein